MQADYAAPKRFATIHNAFDPEDFPAVSARRDRMPRLVLTHTGTLYGPRNPVPFLRVIANLIRAGRLSPDRILIRLVGNCEGPLGRTVPGLVAELGLQQVVELLPPVWSSRGPEIPLRIGRLAVVRGRPAPAGPGQALRVPARRPDHFGLLRRRLGAYHLRHEGWRGGDVQRFGTDGTPGPALGEPFLARGHPRYGVPGAHRLLPAPTQ